MRKKLSRIFGIIFAFIVFYIASLAASYTYDYYLMQNSCGITLDDYLASTGGSIPENMFPSSAIPEYGDPEWVLLKFEDPSNQNAIYLYFHPSNSSIERVKQFLSK